MVTSVGPDIFGRPFPGLFLPVVALNMAVICYRGVLKSKFVEECRRLKIMVMNGSMAKAVKRLQMDEKRRAQDPQGRIEHPDERSNR